MKRFFLIVIGIAVVGAGSFITGSFLMNRGLLNEHGQMASDNFATALALFRDGYQAKRIHIFGESEEHSGFVIDGYEFVVIPGTETISVLAKEPVKSEVGNMASHVNGMAVMLACKWIDDGNDRGVQLLEKLKKTFPHYQVSAPGIGTIPLTQLEVGSEMMKSEADQWIWRMDDLQLIETVQQGGADQPVTGHESAGER